jgi:hypothetical protein
VFGDTLSFTGLLAADRRTRHAAVQAGFKNKAIGRNGPSRIWDAVDSVVSAMEGEPGRHAIFLVTDGQASGNRLGLSAVLRHAQAADVAVCIIASGAHFPVENGSGQALLTPFAAMARLTSETGGFLVEDSVGDLFRPRHPARFFQPLLETLRNSYVLSVDAPRSAGTHQIAVRVDTGAQAHARSAYVSQ